MDDIGHSIADERIYISFDAESVTVPTEVSRTNTQSLTIPSTQIKKYESNFRRYSTQYKKLENCCFEVTDIYGNNEFNIQNIIDDVLPTNVHEYAKDEHVGFIDN